MEAIIWMTRRTQITRERNGAIKTSTVAMCGKKTLYIINIAGIYTINYTWSIKYKYVNAEYKKSFD